MKKRKDGRYERKIYLGKKEVLDSDGMPVLDENGRPVFKKEYQTIIGTKDEVEEKYLLVKVQLGQGIDVKAANDRFSLWADRLIANKEAQGLSPGHIVRLKNDRKHLAPLDAIPISKITIGDIQAIIDNLARIHHKDPTRPWKEKSPPLAKKTLLSIKQTASQIFKLAVASRVLTYNPADFVTIPKNAAQEKREALTDEQQGWVSAPLMVKVNGELVDHRARRAAMIMLYAGLRRGELLALTWADIDLKARTIRVNKTIRYEINQPIIRHGAKTDASMRTVRMPKLLCKYLTAEKKKDSCMYVIHTRDGSIMSQSAWKRMWESYMTELNVAYGYTEKEKEKKNITSSHNPRGLEMRINTFTPHQLRHTCCTLMYFAGVDVLVASKQMGHADVQTTLRIYTHLDEEFGNKDLDKFDKFLGSSDVRQTTKKETKKRGNA